MLKLTRASLLFVVGLTLSVSAFAADPLESTLSGSVVKSVSGKEVFNPIDKSLPGDTIEYQNHYVNHDKVPLTNIEATIPVPLNTEYIPGSAHPAPSLGSTDGATFSPLPLKHIVKTADGRQREELVPTTEYRALRWIIGTLPVGKDATVRLRVKLNSTPQ